jgi:hypothetical protein
MRPNLVKFILKNIEGLEILSLPATFLIGLYMKFFTRVPPIYLPRSYKWFTKCNWLPVRFHYYQPIIKLDMLPEDYVNIENQLIGIDLDIKSQLSLLGQFHYNEELEAIPLAKTEAYGPYYDNIYFQSGDAEILYSVIRHYKPKKIIEIGSGESTKFMCLAIAQNKRETQNETELICIEPFEQLSWLEKLGVTVIRQRVERLDLSLFRELSQNDILFIDSSHVIRAQGDVVFEYLNIIPSLAKGVIVHCHEIFLPREYPLTWIDGWKRFWNEQYLLQALLAHTTRYKPLLSLNFLAHHFRQDLEKCCPVFRRKKEKAREPFSFWFKVME